LYIEQEKFALNAKSCSEGKLVLGWLNIFLSNNQTQLLLNVASSNYAYFTLLWWGFRQNLKVSLMLFYSFTYRHLARRTGRLKEIFWTLKF
jgi:hypothetical protein